MRSGKSTSSELLPGRLAAGAIVEEVELVGERLHFKRLSGSGPSGGWISCRLKGRDLVTPFKPRGDVSWNSSPGIVSPVTPNVQSRDFQKTGSNADWLALPPGEFMGQSMPGQGLMGVGLPGVPKHPSLGVFHQNTAANMWSSGCSWRNAICRNCGWQLGRRYQVTDSLLWLFEWQHIREQRLEDLTAVQRSPDTAPPILQGTDKAFAEQVIAQIDEGVSKEDLQEQWTELYARTVRSFSAELRESLAQSLAKLGKTSLSTALCELHLDDATRKKLQEELQPGSDAVDAQAERLAEQSFQTKLSCLMGLGVPTLRCALEGTAARSVADSSEDALVEPSAST